MIVNGCSHPVIGSLIERAIELLPASVHLVIGGFHLKDHRRPDIIEITQAFRRLSDGKVAPSHCTREKAIGLFSEILGAEFNPSGAGKNIHVN